MNARNISLNGFVYQLKLRPKQFFTNVWHEHSTRVFNNYYQKSASKLGHIM